MDIYKYFAAPKKGFSDEIARYFPSNERLSINSKYCKNLTFQVTEDCNLRCTYCYQINKSKKSMSFETAKKAIDCLFKDNNKIDSYFALDNITGIILDFIGGEPFLEVELMDHIVDYFVEQAFKYKSVLAYRYMISISTNGTLYNDPKVQKFIKKWGPKLSLIVSLDGCKELHDSCRIFPDGSGSYDLAVDAVKQERLRGNDLSTKMTFAPENISYIPRAIKNLIDLGYTQIFCNCVFEDVWNKDDAKLFYIKLKETADYLLSLDTDIIPHVSIFSYYCGKPKDEKYDNSNYCGGNGLMLCVNPAGNFYPCQRFTEVSLGSNVEPYIIGNVDRGIGNTENDSKKIECLACITRRSQSTDECFNCPVGSECAWCTAYNYQVFGTPNKRATFICDMHKARVLANCYFWNKLNRLNGDKERFKLNLDDATCLEYIDENELFLLRELERD